MVIENCFDRCVGSAARAVFGEGFRRLGECGSLFDDLVVFGGCFGFQPKFAADWRRMTRMGLRRFAELRMWFAIGAFGGCFGFQPKFAAD